VARRVGAVAAEPGRAELRGALAGPVAASVVADALGLDGHDDHVVDELLGWYRAIVDSVSGAGAGNPVTDAGATAMSALRDALERCIDTDPTSLLGEVAARSELSTGEVVANAAVVMFGGIETTEAMILNAVWFILRSGWRPAGPGPAAVADAVEESLRLEPAAAEVDRYATVDTSIGDTAIPAGSFVVVSLAGANRDPAEFADPDRFDPSRPNLRRQLAFATGPHVCLGMDLARLETCHAVSALLAALPGLRLGEASPAPSGLVFRKPARLDVSWSAQE
jgi:cytochrome P450